MYIIGIDGGGTKTHCIIGDKKGNILAEGFGGSANYQVVGLETTRGSIENAMKKAWGQLQEKTNQELDFEIVDKIILGLAGADQAMDFKNLNDMCQSLFSKTPFAIYNDTWIGLRSGSAENYGVISICGTGAAHAGRDKSGKTLILRNIDYITGNLGGGSGLVEDALHYAFRSNEETYIKSSLEQKMLQVFKVDTVDEVCDIIRNGQMNASHHFKIPIAVFEAANEGDQVARMLIHNMGKAEGEYAAAIIKRLGLGEEAVPMVLIGSLFKTNNPILIKPYMDVVHTVAPKAYAVIPSVAPVVGAYYLGLDELEYSNQNNKGKTK